jgi:hypothetical protein
MTAVIIPFAVLKARIDAREEHKLQGMCALMNEPTKDCFLRAMRELQQSKRPSDCGEWPKWEDYL